MQINFRNHLKGVASAIIQRVMEKLDDQPGTEELFLQWSKSFANLEEPDPVVWEKLRHHINFPI